MYTENKPVQNFDLLSLPPPTRLVSPLTTQLLFKSGQKEIQIKHGDEIYRLRITRRNKLILQK